MAKKSNKPKKKAASMEESIQLQPAVEETPIAEPMPEFEGKPLAEPSTSELPSSSETTPQGPCTSPYAEVPVELLTGPEETVHYVPRHLLPPGWSKTGLEKRLTLSDLDKATGHTLVHYLYTKRYETLATRVDSPALEAVIKLERALLVYISTITYTIPKELQQLAVSEMDAHGSKMDIFGILNAVKDHFSKLDSESWVHEYLLKKAKAAFEEDHTVFKTNAFMESVGNADLNKFMMSCVIDLYSEKISHMIDTELDRRNQVQTETVEECVPGHDMEVQEDFIAPQVDETPAEDCCGQEIFEEDVATTEEFCTISCPPSECAVDIPFEEAPPVEKCCEPELAPECLIEDFQVPLQDAEQKCVETTEPDTCEEEAVERGWFGTAVVEVRPEAKEDAAAAAVELNSEDVPTINPFKGLSKLQKRKLEKKMKNEAAAKAFENVKCLRIEAEDEELKKLKEAEAALKQFEEEKAEARRAEEAEIERLQVEDEAAAAAAASGAAAAEAESSWNWVATATKSKEKKPSPPPPEAEPEPEPAPEPSPVNEEDPWAIPLASSKKISSDPDLSSTGLSREICPLRVQHLENDQWMECKQCRAILQQVAEQLVHRDFYEQGTGKTRQSIGLPSWIF